VVSGCAYVAMQSLIKLCVSICQDFISTLKTPATVTALTAVIAAEGHPGRHDADLNRLLKHSTELPSHSATLESHISLKRRCM